MHRFLLLAALLLTTSILSAQEAIPTKNMMSFTTPSSEAINGTTQSFFADTGSKVFFIDFQSLSVNLNEIIVKDELGSVILEDKVFDLPVDTIYELDLTKFKRGKYAIELKSFTSTIHKNVTVK